MNGVTYTEISQTPHSQCWAMKSNSCTRLVGLNGRLPRAGPQWPVSRDKWFFHDQNIYIRSTWLDMHWAIWTRHLYTREMEQEIHSIHRQRQRDEGLEGTLSQAVSRSRGLKDCWA